ncbi:asparagine synthase (glutamine-hydrolyzing) [Halieaceae bacterium IMCC14734]|uniref:asparagine synthase (glutamine-hydrolyzing) n=1 Tax=Candidatus Litorirhabdus singularis TaxID=2518993 RepID=A0ABT3TC42_9GAMM|nr:asparagine synthase (glutamine-hydrolyzing) [Candidatus Litorirhabdus singularis]MCX2979854.1 asparagine synthase (glutamine-hydrolyzing) [Candidatus Litorirhabdus singularis]
MCGIVGGTLRGTLESGRLEAALESLHHRGPDSRGRWIAEDGASFLGHTRLSIIGLDNGSQPLSDHDGNVQMVVNGEFYGYRKIRENLQREGCQFKTDSDSEIALHLYLREGMNMCQHLRGEYAVLIADQRNRAMIAIRDRFGINPLYYAVHNGEVFFASEIKALLELGVPARWCPQALLQESYLVRPHSHSLFQGIYTVPPGHYAVAQNGQVSLYPYWDMDFPTAEELATDSRSDEEVVAGFREVLSDAISERMVADVEVASYLSGGIDSCAVLGLAQTMATKPIRAFTLAFDDALFDESALAEQQAKLCGANYNPVPVGANDLADYYSDAVWHAETPFVNGHGVAKYLLSRAVRDAGIKVVFTGEGADEMLGGYVPFRRDLLLYNSESQDPATVQRLLAEMRESNKAVPALVGNEGARCAELDLVERQLGFVPSWMEIFAGMGDKTRELFSADLTARVAGINPYAMSLARLPVASQMSGRDPLNQGLYSWSRIHLPNFILTFLSDRMEMAHSIEGRVPFLDTRVAEFSAHMPIHMKIKGMREKHVLREAARDVIIEEVYNREKHPFATPPAKASDNDGLYQLYADTFHSKALEDQPVFDPAAVRKAFAAMPDLPFEQQALLDNLLNRVLSMTLMHQRFGMSSP